jgi:O-antigen ligase
MNDPAEQAWAHASWRSRANFTVFVLFLVLVLLCGGASRADVLGQGIVRLAAVIVIAAGIVQLDREGWRRVRTPALLLLGLIVIIAIQLAPLPPGLWSSLPGRSVYQQALQIAGIPPVWRPISLTPDLTLNSLLATLPALATVIGLGLVRPYWHPILVPVLLAGIAASALLGVVQVSTGSPYFYAVTNHGSAVGMFANRNHEALFLAAAFPLLAAFAGFGGSTTRVAARTWLAATAATAVFPLLLVTGSRGGLLLGLIGSLFGAAIFFGARRLKPRAARMRRSTRWLIAGIPLVLGAVAIVVFRYFGRDVALQRVFGGEFTTVRVDFLPIFVRMSEDFFPTGAGFGSFDTLFRAYEPNGALDRTYLNHAHNDLAELLIEGGLLAGAVLLAFLFWYAKRTLALWIRPVTDADQLLGRLGSALIAMAMLGSLVDYPVRTPIISVLVAISACWMALSGGRHSNVVGLPRSATSGNAAAPRA